MCGLVFDLVTGEWQNDDVQYDTIKLCPYEDQTLFEHKTQKHNRKLQLSLCEVAY